MRTDCFAVFFMRLVGVGTLMALGAGGAGAAAEQAAGSTQTLTLDERPAGGGEWGYHPGEGQMCQVTPPGFTWRPQQGITSWEIQCARDTQFREIEYAADKMGFSVHCPPKAFAPGAYTWRYRGLDARGGATNWSQPRAFTIAPYPSGSARAMPFTMGVLATVSPADAAWTQTLGAVPSETSGGRNPNCSRSAGRRRPRLIPCTTR